MMPSSKCGRVYCIYIHTYGYHCILYYIVYDYIIVHRCDVHCTIRYLTLTYEGGGFHDPGQVVLLQRLPYHHGSHHGWFCAQSSRCPTRTDGGVSSFPLIVWNLCCACYAVGCVCWRDRKQNYHWLHLDWTTCQYGLQAGHMTSDSESITVRFCSTASVFKVLRNPWTDSIYLFWPRMCLLGCWDDGVLLNQIAFSPLWQIIIEREIAFLCRKATSHAAYQGKIDEDKDIESMKRGEVSCFHVFVVSDVFNVPREINPTTTVTPWIVFFVIICLSSFQWWVGVGGST